MQFAKFMSSTTGRLVRVGAGVVLIIAGAVLGGGWFALAVIGLVPLAAGAGDVCLFAPLFGQPLKGRDLPRRLSRQAGRTSADDRRSRLGSSLCDGGTAVRG